MTFAALRSLIIAALIAAAPAMPLHAQTQKPPAAPRKPTPASPAPATQKPAPATQKPAQPAPPPKPVPQDLRFKTVYTTGDQKTESVSYQKGARERFEFADMLLLKQHDLKRTVQVSSTAGTYLVVPDGASPMPALPAPPAAAPQTPGVVTVTTTIVDTGERKTAFGLQARHVKMTMDRQPMPGACDPAKQHVETDGWYVDVPGPVLSPQSAAPPAGGGCIDQVKATQNGDARVLGFPIGYSTTITGDDGKPNVVAMEITELEVTTLDPNLFEIPAGLKEAGDLRALSQAMSDASEAKLAQQTAAPVPAAQKTPGVVLIAVPELTNKTAQQVDTRALRAQLVSELTEAKLSATPISAPAAEVIQLAAANGYDYVLIAEVTELKVSKGGIGGMLKAASKVTAGGPSKDPTEASLAIKLVQPDGKARVSSTVKGKDGGFDVKTGIGVAKFAGSMYMNMMTGKMMLQMMNGGMAGNLKGMGMLGNPALMNMQTSALMNMQTGGLGLGIGAVPTMRMGMDPTAGAASFLTQQAMTASGPLPGVAGQPSYDAALNDALEGASKTVAEALKKAEPKKK